MPERTVQKHSRVPARHRPGIRLGLLVLCAVVLLGALPYQQGSVDLDLQSNFLLSILEYERSLAERAGDEVVIGILYQPLYRASVNVHDGMREGLARAREVISTVRPVRVVSVETVDGAGLAAELSRLGVDVLYLAPLRSVALDRITAVTRERHVMSFSGVPDYVDRGVSVGVRAREGRPRLVVNRAATAAEGVRFSSELLKVAELVQEDG